jgi:hypothetical protein
VDLATVPIGCQVFFFAGHNRQGLQVNMLKDVHPERVNGGEPAILPGILIWAMRTDGATAVGEHRNTAVVPRSCSAGTKERLMGRATD